MNAEPRVRSRLRITTADTIATGTGKISLLEANEQTGSLTAAGKNIEMLFRRDRLRLCEVIRAPMRPALASAEGRELGGVLTSVGGTPVQRYRGVEAIAAESCSADIKTLIGLLAR